MSDRHSLLTEAVRARSNQTDVALLLSGGIGSISVGLACQSAGKPSRPASALDAVSRYRPYNMRDVLASADRRLFTCVSTFSGGGGSSIGYSLAGGKVLAASEFVPEAVRTYQRNFPATFVDDRDIREITANEDSIKSFLGRVGLSIGELDVLDGSPPCSEFSIAGKGIVDSDIMRPYSDVEQKSIAALPFDFIHLVTVAHPKVFIMENVPQLAGERNRLLLENMLREVRTSYYANYAILQADNFGVSQKRRRLILIGVRKDIGDRVGVIGDDAIQRLFPLPTDRYGTIRSALAGLEQNYSDKRPFLESMRSHQLGRLVRALPKNPIKHTRLSDVGIVMNRSFTLTRCAWDLPSPTLVVFGQKPNGISGQIHPEEDRKFTVPELKRLFALPDDFVLTGTVSQATERICRMVPPLMTKAIAERIYERVLKPYKETTP